MKFNFPNLIKYNVKMTCENISVTNNLINLNILLSPLISAIGTSAGEASGNNKFYPTNSNGNGNVELENLYKHYKSTGQVRKRRRGKVDKGESERGKESIFEIQITLCRN